MSVKVVAGGFPPTPLTLPITRGVPNTTGIPLPTLREIV